ncbi:hypothetical protein MLD38_019412 [Melastoma candidum]|uniref:Uncharacterized protein n=1 Tax=Melastoma candidum TaxID=119954 RepID=A0ACB9QW22_9MYRT|nr:hypothetical protein MLD38_019412 [Melastoma candidum]
MRGGEDLVKSQSSTGDLLIKTVDPRSPHFLHPSDNPSAMISSCILKRENYDLRVKALRNSLKATNKVGFINGSLTTPAPGSVEANLWEICLFRGFLMSSTQCCSRVCVCETARELWIDLHDCLSISNAPRIYQLKSEIVMLMQKGSSIVDYYTKLKGMWDELSGYSKVPDKYLWSSM